MDWFWSFLFYSLPWWLQVVLLALILGVPTYLVVAMIWGRPAANRLLLPIAGALAALGLASKLKQSGYNDRRAEEEKALDKAEEIVADEKQDVQRLPDVEVDKEIEEWTRK
jgi:hypothetical protein